MTGSKEKGLEQLLEALLEGDSNRTRSAIDALQSRSATDEAVPREAVEKAANTAALLLTMGQTEQACLMLEALIEHCGPDVMLLNNLAFAHLLGGRADKAVELLEQAVALEPGNELIAGNLQRARSKLDNGQS